MNTSELSVGDLVRITHTRGWSHAYRAFPTTEITWRVHEIGIGGGIQLLPIIDRSLPDQDSALVLYAPFENNSGPYLTKI